MATPTRLLTAEEFFELLEDPEGGRSELVDGEVVRMAPVGGKHGGAASEIVVRLAPFARQCGLGRAGVVIGFRLRRDPDLVRAPDVNFVRTERLPNGNWPETFVEGAPTLAIEVVSPRDSDVYIAGKVEEYLAAGAERVWVARPAQRTITVHWPNGDAHVYRSGDVLTSGDAAFPVEGFELAVDDVFA